MPTITNSPQDSTTLRVETRKSFNLALLLRDSNSAPIDLADATASLTIAKINPYSDPTILVAKPGIVQAAGYITFPLQADELVGNPTLTYEFVVVLLSGGYSKTLLKGPVEFQANVETDSAGESYTIAPPTTLSVLLEENTVHVDFDRDIPPDVARLPGGGMTGQVAVKASNDSYDLVWSYLDGGLAAPALVDRAPLSVGDGSWAWQAVATATALAAEAGTRGAADTAESAARSAADAATLVTAEAYSDSKLIVAQSYADVKKAEAIVAAAADATTKANAAFAAATAADAVLVPAGNIVMTARSVAPAGWVLCDGSSLLRAGTYAALFAAIGTVYGSVDGTHFNVPNLKGKFVVGLDASQTEFDALGETGGAKSHSHILSANGSAQFRSGTSQVWNETSSADNLAWTATKGASGVTIAANASVSAAAPIAQGIALNGRTDVTAELPPYMALNYIIKA